MVSSEGGTGKVDKDGAPLFTTHYSPCSRRQPMEARTSRYPEAYRRWQRDPEGFWAEAAREIDWIEPAGRVFDPDAGVYGRWFAGAVCNTCWNAVDRHVMGGRGEQAAIIYDSP